MKPLQQLVLSQHQLPLLGLVRGDLCSKHLAGLDIPTQVYNAETPPRERSQQQMRGCVAEELAADTVLSLPHALYPTLSMGQIKTGVLVVKMEVTCSSSWFNS